MLETDYSWELTAMYQVWELIYNKDQLKRTFHATLFPKILSR